MRSGPIARALLRVVLVLLALAALLFAGFRLWLARQPPETRLAVEAFTPLELLVVTLDEVLDRPIEDFGAYDRRPVAGRGHAPWVLRASLDGRPRMLLAALAPEHWIAWSTETASVHQLWRGDVDFSGPAFDARHGFEPMSRGTAFWRADAATAWRVEADGVWVPARTRWRGHGFDHETGRLWLDYEVGDGTGPWQRVIEWPERIDGGQAGDREPGGEFALERIFERWAGAGDPDPRFDPSPQSASRSTGTPMPPIALVVSSAAASLESDARLESDALLRLRPGRTRIVQRFAAPIEPIVHASSPAVQKTAFSAFDCETCHHERERIVGPAWQEIARRQAGSNRDAAASILAERIRGGSVGRWGDVPMPPHRELTQTEATALAVRILASVDDEAPSPREPAAARPASRPAEGAGSVAEHAAGTAPSTTYRSDVAPRPERLHPSLSATSIAPPGFTPRVGGLAWLPDGRLAVATWDADGSVYLVERWAGPPREIRVRRIAEGLHEPLGLAFADGALHVIQKQEITRLVDRDGDDRIDAYRTLANDWTATSNFHEFGFGLPERGGRLYFALSACILKGGKSCGEQTRDRGRLLRAALATGRVETVASGLRTPNGVAVTPGGALLVTDNQGDWLPASKLIRVEPGADYGWRPPGQTPDPDRTTPPTLWLPHNEIANSPTQPLVLTRGPYAGQVIFGDVYNGGLKRAALEEVAGTWQGAAFHFSGGLGGPANRLIEVPGGGLVVGEIGSRGNWGEFGKPWHGLELLRFTDEPAFEPRAVSLTPRGFDVELTRALAPDVALDVARFRVEDWYYVPTPSYGGPKYDLRRLPVASIAISSDRRVVSLAVPGLAAGRVVYLRLDPAIRSERGEALWVDEAWYTINALAAPADGRAAALAVEAGRSTPRAASAGHAAGATPEASAGHAAGATKPTASAPSRADGSGTRTDDAPLRVPLTPEQRAAGWEPLFDGRTFAGWRNYGGAEDAIEGWRIVDGALEFTRDVSFAGLAWNHLNPFGRPALDLMTKERFRDFELALEWKIAPGGNSGIFYRVPDERERVGWFRAPEMQVLDDARHPDGRKEKRRAGDLYDVVASSRRMARPAGEWNAVRIRVEGDRIEHWLNGERVVAIEVGSPEWERAVVASKHAGTPDYGRAREGHILLQDHGDVVWYRHIAIRRLGR